MLWIDENLCIGCGTCANVCPDGFQIKNGKPVIKDPNASCISKAMLACPVGAIKPDTEKSMIRETQSRVPPEVFGTERGMKDRGLGIGHRIRRRRRRRGGRRWR